MWSLKQTFTRQLLMIMQIELPKISSDDDVICPPQHHLGAYVKTDKGFHSFLISLRKLIQNLLNVLNKDRTMRKISSQRQHIVLNPVQ